MRYLTLGFFFSAAVLLVALFFHNIIEFDQDLGRHLLMGEIILERGSVPLTNLLSYTHPGSPFVNTHWLSEVTFYLVGVPGLLYGKVFVLGGAFLLTTYTAYKYSRNLAATAVAFTLFVPVLLERTEIRPEMFSFLFAAIFIFMLTLEKKHLFWVLPIIQLFWVNAHIYFILGPILMAVFLIKYYKDKKYLIYFGISLFACLINPNGMVGAFYPLNVFNNYGYSIVENQNVFLLGQITGNVNITFFWIGLISLIASFLVTKKIEKINLVLAGLVILPILHIRSFPLLFLMLLPIFAFNLANARFKIPWQTYIVGFAIGLTLIRGFRLMTNDYYLSIDSSKRFGNEISESGKGAADFVVKNKLTGPIFNNFDIGSYLDYRFYPKNKVFVDGRPEAYPTEFFQSVYIPMQMTAENFSKVDEIYKFKTIVFAHTDQTPWAQQFLSDIGKNKNWHVAYLDPYAVVLTKQATNSTIIPGKDYLENARLGNIYAVFGNENEANKYYQMTSIQQPKPGGMIWF